MNPKKDMLDWFDRWKIKPREQQLDAIDQIANGWHKKYHICNLPTGTGKSFLAMAMGAAAGRSYVLTHTKQLQDQYLTGPGGAIDLRGRGNYPCGIIKNMNAAEAPCVSFKQIQGKCISSGCCEYLTQRGKAIAGNVMLTNYLYFLFARHCGPLMDLENTNNIRDLLVCDEGHTIENHLVSFSEIHLDPAELKEKFGIFRMNWLFTGSDSENQRIVEEVYTDFKNKWVAEESEIKALYLSCGLGDNATLQAIKALPEKMQRKIQDKVREHDKTDKFFNKLKVYKNYDSDWMIHAEKKDNVLTISPLRVAGLFHPYFGRSANKYMFLSATIGCPEEYAAELGLDKSECNFVSIDDSFDSERSPIVYVPVGKFNYDEIDRTLPSAVKAIDSILDQHKGDKGVIHTSNYKIAEYYAKNSKHFRRILHRNMGKFPYSNTQLFEMHAERKDDSVLVSPSMTTGISLDDDLARFQIIVKLPFASLGDPRISKKAEKWKGWYVNKMWQEIMQASGRGMRSSDDYCVTYILDGSFRYYQLTNSEKLPKWFLKRIVK